MTSGIWLDAWWHGLGASSRFGSCKLSKLVPNKLSLPYLDLLSFGIYDFMTQSMIYPENPYRFWDGWLRGYIKDCVTVTWLRWDGFIAIMAQFLPHLNSPSENGHEVGGSQKGDSKSTGSCCNEGTRSRGLGPRLCCATHDGSIWSLSQEDHSWKTGRIEFCNYPLVN